MTIAQSPLLLLGLALLGNLISGVVGYAVGRARPRGPTRTIEVYEGPDIPF